MTDYILGTASSAAAANIAQVQQLAAMPQTPVFSSTTFALAENFFDNIAKQYSDAVTASGAIAQAWKVESVNSPKIIADYASGTVATGRFSSQIQLAANDLAWEVAA